jgi:hypothetical protein
MIPQYSFWIHKMWLPLMKVYSFMTPILPDYGVITIKRDGQVIARRTRKWRF